MIKDNKDTLFFATTSVVLCVMCVVIFIFLVFDKTYSSRCSKAGYKGAELELCIKRVKKGLPVYKENIENWNKGY